MSQSRTRGIDWLYDICGYLAMLCIISLLALIIVQVVLRWLGSSLPGVSSYASYLLGISTFLGLSYTLRAEGHIRVELFMTRFGWFSQVLEIWSIAFSMVIAGYISWYFCDAAYWSYQFGALSSSLDSTPLWIPQCVMAAGAVIFTLALLDRLIRTIVTGFRPSHVNRPDDEVEAH